MLKGMPARAENRKTKRADGGWGLTLTEVSALLQAGLPPATAWQPLVGEGGGSLSERVEAWAAAQPAERRADAVKVAAVHRLSASLGVPASALLEGCIRVFTAQAAASDARALALAGPRASSRVLFALPLLGLILGTALGADPIGALLGGGVGLVLLVAGGTALTVGGLWSRALLRAASRAPDDSEPFALELVAAAIAAGASIPAALGGAGHAIGGEIGGTMSAVASRLQAGAAWERAWGSAAGSALERGLAPAWEFGVAPGPMLTARADLAHRAVAHDAAVQASRLSVRLLLPLGLCYLPAFLLLGLAPVVLAMVTQFLAT